MENKCNGEIIREVNKDNEWIFNLVNRVLTNLKDKYCTKCGDKIQIGSVFKLIDDNYVCETCLGITNPYDNPDKYKYFWGGQYISLDKLPDIAKQFFPTLRK